MSNSKKNKSIIPISDCWARRYTVPCDKQLPLGIKPSDMTFCGAFEEFYSSISLNWGSDQTKNDYNRIMENHILPALVGHNEKLIFEYTADDFNRMNEIIRNKRVSEDGIVIPYSESYITKINQIVYYTIYFASAYHYCENVLKGTRYSLYEVPVEEQNQQIHLIKKHLTYSQEKKMLSFLEDDCMPGEILGNLIMWILGTRDSEACGLNYGDIRPMIAYPEERNAWIYKSTVPNSNTIQTGGKTANMNRIVPAAEKLLSLLSRRYKKIVLFSNELGVDPASIPLANRGALSRETFQIRCSNIDISYAGKNMLSSVGVASEVLAYLDSELYKITNDVIVKDSTPTSYMLRRNFATIMKILGLSLSERQYEIGHDIESGDQRSSFTNEKCLHEIRALLTERPLLNEHKVQEIPLGKTHISLPMEFGKNAYTIPLKGKKAVITIRAKEPLDTIKISFPTKDSPAIVSESIYDPVSYPEFIDVRAQYIGHYT